MAIRKHKVKVSTAGSAGSAVGSGLAVTGIGRLVAVHVDYAATAPATTDLTLTSEGDPDGPASVALLAVANTVTDGWYYPTNVAVDAVGALVAGLGVPPVVHAGAIGVSLAQCNALTDAAIVSLYVES